MFEGGKLQQEVNVLVNGRSISLFDGLKPPLAPFDQATLFINGARGFPGE